MMGVEVEALIAKSTTFTAGCAMKFDWAAPLFALALPEIVICGLTIGADGVMSTSTVAVAFTARVGILQEIVDPNPCCTLPQLPEPLVTLAVGVDARPVVGNPRALKTTRLAGSVPLGLELVMSKVNAT